MESNNNNNETRDIIKSRSYNMLNMFSFFMSILTADNYKYVQEIWLNSEYSNTNIYVLRDDLSLLNLNIQFLGIFGQQVVEEGLGIQIRRQIRDRPERRLRIYTNSESMRLSPNAQGYIKFVEISREAYENDEYKVLIDFLQNFFEIEIQIRNNISTIYIKKKQQYNYQVLFNTYIRIQPIDIGNGVYLRDNEGRIIVAPVLLNVSLSEELKRLIINLNLDVDTITEWLEIFNTVLRNADTINLFNSGNFTTNSQNVTKFINVNKKKNDLAIEELQNLQNQVNKLKNVGNRVRNNNIEQEFVNQIYNYLDILDNVSIEELKKIINDKQYQAVTYALLKFDDINKIIELLTILSRNMDIGDLLEVLNISLIQSRNIKIIFDNGYVIINVTEDEIDTINRRNRQINIVNQIIDNLNNLGTRTRTIPERNINIIGEEEIEEEEQEDVVELQENININQALIAAIIEPLKGNPDFDDIINTVSNIINNVGNNIGNNAANPVVAESDSSIILNEIYGRYFVDFIGNSVVSVFNSLRGAYSALTDSTSRTSNIVNNIANVLIVGYMSKVIFYDLFNDTMNAIIQLLGITIASYTLYYFRAPRTIINNLLIVGFLSYFAFGFLNYSLNLSYDLYKTINPIESIKSNSVAVVDNLKYETNKLAKLTELKYFSDRDEYYKYLLLGAVTVLCGGYAAAKNYLYLSLPFFAFGGSILYYTYQEDKETVYEILSIGENIYKTGKGTVNTVTTISSALAEGTSKIVSQGVPFLTEKIESLSEYIPPKYAFTGIIGFVGIVVVVGGIYYVISSAKKIKDISEGGEIRKHEVKIKK